MTENHSGMRSRPRRSDRAQRLYAARELYPAEEEVLPSASEDKHGYTPNEESAMYDDSPAWQAPADMADPSAYAAYTPNEMEQEAAPVQEPVKKMDFSAYYRRNSGGGDATEPAFAPPPKLDFLGYDAQAWNAAPQDPAPCSQAQGNVYRPREATWANTARRDILSADGIGYQVREDDGPPRVRKRRRHTLRNALITLSALAALAGTAWLLRGHIEEWLSQAGMVAQVSDEPFAAVTTPQPVKGYDAAPAVEIADSTRAAIGRISGTVEMETCAVTDTHVLTRNQRPDGAYDFYLFTASEGRLLCYFEGLGPQGVFPQQNGGFYADQEPYLVAANGSALIRMADIESTYGERMRLYPLYNGWSIIQSQEDGNANYINASGQMISTLWFARAFPFTGHSTAAYVDTGSAADANQRYLLYVLGQDGTMSRWLAEPDMTGLVASACDMAYMNTGEMFHLPDTSAPLVTSPQVDAYLDCDAFVVRDAESGKYGLFVHGEQHYDFVYDSIQPVKCDIQWSSQTFQGDGGSFTMHAVTGAAYPQPLSHSFVLEREGQREYVALSTQSCYPIRLEGEY